MPRLDFWVLFWVGGALVALREVLGAMVGSSRAVFNGCCIDSRVNTTVDDKKA